MFLHLGGDILVETKDIISIIDVEKNNSKITLKFLETAKEKGLISKISNEDPKSIIITQSKRKKIVFLSPISSSTLFKRARFIEETSII